MKKLLIFLTLCLSSQLITAQNECPTFEWAVNAGTGDVRSQAVVTDSLGNTYITGVFIGTSTFGSTTLTSSGGWDIFIAKLNPQGNFLWAVKAGGSSYDYGYSISVDNQGNTYVTGYFEETSTFGSTTLTSSGYSDVFIAKLNPQGQFLWVVKAGGTGYDQGNSISVDNQGNAYVTGYVTGISTFGDIVLISNALNEIFIAKINSQGQFLWISMSVGSEGAGSSIDVDYQNNIYITGKFKGTSTFGNTTLISSGINDVFIAKLDHQGQFLWAVKAGSSANDYGTSISSDNQGNCYLSGSFGGISTFGNITLSPTGMNDVFIAKLNSQGQYVWAIRPQSYYTSISAISADDVGNSYVSGSFTDNLIFDNMTLTSSGNYDVFSAKFNSQGDCLWVLSAGGHSTDKSNSIFIDNQGNAYITGDCNSSLATFGNIQLQSSSAFVTKINQEELAILPMSPITISCGESIELPASSTAYSGLQWSPSLGLSNSTVLNPIASPNTTTTYTLTATNSCGNTVSQNIVVNVTPPFTVSTSAINTTIDCGTSTTLNATVSGNFPNLSYSWSPTIGLSNPTSANPTASPGLTTTYTVTATTPDGCSASSDVLINVNNPNPPSVTIVSNTGVFKLCNGSLTLSAPGFVSYEWSNGSTSPSINVTQPGSYSLIAYEESGCAGTASVTVTALAEILTPQGTVLCPNQAGQSVQLNASGGMDSYQWSTGAQTQGIQVSSAGNYSVTVTKGSCSYTTSVSVTVSNGQAFADFSHSTNGLTVDFTTISPSINFLSWDFGDGTTSFVENPTHTYSQAGTYTVTLTVTDVCGNTVEKTKSISVAVVGIEENTVDNSMILYPNPTNDQFTIKSSTPLKQVILRDLNGKVLFTTVTIQSEIKLNVSHLSNGIYLVETVNESGRCVQKVVKRD